MRVSDQHLPYHVRSCHHLWCTPESRKSRARRLQARISNQATVPILTALHRKKLGRFAGIPRDFPPASNPGFMMRCSTVGANSHAWDRVVTPVLDEDFSTPSYSVTIPLIIPHDLVECVLQHQERYCSELSRFSTKMNGCSSHRLHGKPDASHNCRPNH